MLHLSLEIGKLAIYEFLPQEDRSINYNTYWEILYEFEPEGVFMQWLDRLVEKERVGNLVTKGLATNKPYILTFQLWNKDRTEIKWISNTSKVIERNESGEPVRVLGVSKDITNEKLYASKLERVTDELNKAQKLSKMGSWHLDLRTNEVTWTDEIYRMYGFDPSKPPPPYSEHIKLFTNESWELLSTELNKTAIKGTPYDLELEMASEHASFGWMRAIGEAIRDHNGKIIGLRGTAQDITEIREVHEKLNTEKKFAEAVTESSASGLYIFNLQTNQNEYSNSRCHEILGFTAEELKKMPGNEFISRFHKEDLPEINQHFEKIATLKKPRKIKYRFQHKKGHYVTCLSMDSPFDSDRDGNVKTILGSFVDITELQRKEEELIHTRNEAIAANKQKDIFMSNLSHEIRTPINGIVGFSKLLKENDISDDSREKYISQIEKESNQLMRIIDDILDISRLDSGKLKIVNKSVDLNQLIEELVDTYSTKLKLDKNENLKLSSYLPKVPIIANFDPERISQVIINLITNAIKFTAKGKIIIGCSIYKEKFIRIWVKDEGIGIKKEHQKLIFERFSQVEEKLSLQMGGLGLGLSICRSIMDSIGGNILLKSEYGKGSKFTIEFPFKSGKLKKVSSEKKRIPVISKVKKIIIADDSASIQLYYQSILQKLNLTVFQAYDGLEAVELFKKERNIDLVFMDIRMPKMDGISALKEIKKINKNVRVVAQSAFALGDQVKNFKSQGFDEYFTKPINAKEIYRLINQGST